MSEKLLLAAIATLSIYLSSTPAHPSTTPASLSFRVASALQSPLRLPRHQNLPTFQP